MESLVKLAIYTDISGKERKGKYNFPTFMYSNFKKNNKWKEFNLLCVCGGGEGIWTENFKVLGLGYQLEMTTGYMTQFIYYKRKMK